MDNPLAIETSRLKLDWLDLTDADFIYQLVNDPQWLRFIGDKQVTDLAGYGDGDHLETDDEEEHGV